MNMQIYAKRLIADLFPEREKIDEAQFILDRSGPVLKTCKIPTASLNCKMLRFFSWSFSEAVHAYSFHMKNSGILAKFSGSILSRCAIFYSHTTHNYATIAKILIFFILMRGPMPWWTWEGVPDSSLHLSIFSLGFHLDFWYH